MTAPTPAADIARCPGHRCPSARHCARATPGAAHTPYAAFHARREPGADKCEHYWPTLEAPKSTYTEGGEA